MNDEITLARAARSRVRSQLLYEDSLQEYEKQTDIALAEHPFAERLQHCDSVESVSAILEEQVCARSELSGSDRIIKSLNSIVSSLYMPSVSVNLVGLVPPEVLMVRFMSLMLSLTVTPAQKKEKEKKAISPWESNICRVFCPTRCTSLSFASTCVSV